VATVINGDGTTNVIQGLIERSSASPAGFLFLTGSKL
jgi:hypothetical protein